MEGESKKETPAGRMIKPCDIPIYGSPVDSKADISKEPAEPGFLQSGICSIRRSLQDAYAPLKQVEEEAVKIYQTGSAHSKETLEVLRGDDLYAGAFVAGTTIFGYAFGALRGRFFKRLFYSSVGLLGGAAAMKPVEFNAVAAEARVEAEKAAAIAYNFVKGVGPGSSKEDDEILKAVEKKVEKDGKHDFGQSNPADKDMYTTRDEKK